MKMKHTVSMISLAAAIGFSAFYGGCGGGEEGPAIPETMSYHADLTEINPDASPGDIVGRAGVTIVGDSLTFAVTARGFEPGSMHLMHIHGFQDSAEATCATAEQDANQDGYVDLIETRAVSGVTMIPLHDNPVGLAIKTDTYPTADEDSVITYQQTVSLAALTNAAQERYGVGEWIFEHGVIYIHGVPETVDLPESVQSLPDVPAKTTIPIACGALSVP